MTQRSKMENDVQAEAIKGSIALGGAAWATLTLNEWVAVATLIYIILQIGLLLPKYWEFWKGYFSKSGKKTRRSEKKK